MTGVQRVLEVGLIVCSALAVFLLLALFSFDAADPSWSQTGYQGPINNAAGAIGAWFADVLLFALGYIAYAIPFALALMGYLLFRQPHRLLELDYLAVALRFIGILLTLIGSTALASLNVQDLFNFSAGGVVGDVLAHALLPYFNFIGTTLLLLTFFLTGITLVSGISWVALADRLGDYTIKGTLWLVNYARSFSLKDDDDSLVTETAGTQSTTVVADKAGPRRAPQQTTTDETESELGDSHEQVAKRRLRNRLLGRGKSATSVNDETDIDSHDSDKALTESLFGAANSSADGQRQEPSLSLPSMSALDEAQGSATGQEAPPRFSKQARQQAPNDGDSAQASTPKTAMMVARQSTASERDEDEHEVQAVTEPLPPLPSIELLDRPDKKENPITQEELDRVSRTVETVLKDFGVDVTVANVQPGPVVTRFELDLAPGVKVSKISNLAKDIARTLSAVAVRVVEVIPGKSYVGLEIPNKHREIVQLSDVIAADVFQKSGSPLTMVLGKGISGSPVVADLAKMPHLLVAGTTGSGKSVGINVMILSLLYKSTPEDVRLIMIDPKMLELSVYEGIPHLLTEVVTDMKDAANALRWCVGEMERRYKLMSALGVRNLKGYNAKVVDAREAGEPLRDPIWKPGDSMDELPPELEKLPSIVVVIDEFADMMMIVGKKVEELIARIAQKARAAGIHLILATQRPSVDVITGLIKANIPTRMAFQVSSKVDSRTILDQPGADQLLGQGDMLYLPPGSGAPVRVHGAFVDDHEVHAVVADWKKRGRPNYLDEILSGDMGEGNLLPGEQQEMDEAEADPLYDEAVAFVTETQRVSVSSVQRKFRIGYNRAARIVEQMEMSGVVSSAGHNGQRDVLAPKPPRD